MRKATRHLIKALPLVVFICFSSVFFFFSTPENVIGWLGVQNAYLLIFCLAFLGGLTTFSGVPYHLVIISMAVGGMNPYILGASAAMGVMLGDSTSYYIGYQGGGIIPDRFQKIFHAVYELSASYPKILPTFCLFYGSLIPFSNDFITISAGLVRYPFWRVMTPLAIGNLIFNVSLALLAIHAQTFIQRIFF